MVTIESTIEIFNMFTITTVFNRCTTFSHLGLWSGNFFLIAPFPDHRLFVPFHTQYNSFQDEPIVAFFSLRNGSVDTFGSSNYISYEIECKDIADSGIERTVSNLLGAT